MRRTSRARSPARSCQLLGRFWPTTTARRSIATTWSCVSTSHQLAARASSATSAPRRRCDLCRDSYLYLKTDDFGNAHDQIREENPESVVWIKDISELSYSAYSSVRPEFQRHHSYARFRSTNELWMRAHVENHCSGLRGRPPSSGFQTIALLATSGVCSAITLYGFCDPPDDQGAHVPYHYYEAVDGIHGGRRHERPFRALRRPAPRGKGPRLPSRARAVGSGWRAWCVHRREDRAARDFARFEERMRCSPALPELPWLDAAPGS